MTALQAAWRSAALVLASVLVALALAEAVVRLAGSDPPSDSGQNKYLTWSSPHFRLDAMGAVRYRPNETVRFRAVYDGTPEYDVVYRVNRQGFIDHRDYLGSEAEGARRIALVGDSFTAGMHGGDPWVPALRDRVVAQAPIALYNLGVSGTGLQHWPLLLESAARELAFTEIVILAISSDFHRELWRPLIHASEVRFCPSHLEEAQCLAQRKPIGYVLPEGAERPAPALPTTASEDGPSPPCASGLPSASALACLAARVVQERRRQTWAERQKARHFAASLEALKRIHNSFPDIPLRFIHLPHKPEVKTGRYDIDPAEAIEARGFEYFPALTRCSWSLAMFHERDGHPNAFGYENIAACVAEYLHLPRL